MEQSTPNLTKALGTVAAVLVALGALTYFVVTAQQNAQSSDPSGTNSSTAQPGDAPTEGDTGPKGDFYLESSKSGILHVDPTPEEKKKVDHFFRSSKSLPLTSEELRPKPKQPPQQETPPDTDD